jgi:hypothetical protein
MHGADGRSLDGDEFAGLIGDWLDGFSDIVVWPCQSGPAVNRRATFAFAARVGELTGRRVHLPEWETALDRDRSTGDVSAHTYPDPEGGETGWISVSPRSGPAPEAGGVLVELPILPEEGEPFGRALARALDRGASLLAEWDGSGEGDTPYQRFVAGLKEEDLPASAPLADEAAQVHVDDLERAGITLPAERSGPLSVGSLGLDRVQRFRLALETRPATGETVAEMAAALDAAAGRLGLRLIPGRTVEAGSARRVRPGPDLRNAATGEALPVDPSSSRRDLRALPGGRRIMLTVTPNLAYGSDRLVNGFRSLLRGRNPILVSSRELGAGESSLPKDLVEGHSYEVVEIDAQGLLHLRDPRNTTHPRPLTIAEFRNYFLPHYITFAGPAIQA